MKFFVKKKNIFLIIPLLFFCSPFFSSASSRDAVNVKLLVDGCNNNFICEAATGESVSTCPNDCQDVVTPPVDNGGGSTDGRSGSRTNDSNSDKPAIVIDTISPSSNTINITWTSNIPVNASISWGTNSDYGAGRLQEIGFIKEHSFVLYNLLPQTNYEIRISVENLNGEITSHSLLVQTTGTIQSIPTIQKFEISPQNKGLLLTWQNPASDFDYVRILKSETFFPSSIADGEIVYEGRAKSFFDTEINTDTRYYYTIFVKRSADISSGASQSSMIKSGNIDVPISIFEPGIKQETIMILDKSPFEIHMYQDGLEVSKINNLYYLVDQKDVVITLELEDDLQNGLQAFFSYVDQDDPDKSENYVFTYDKNTKKYVTSFNVSDIKNNSSFVIYLKSNEEITGYSGYVHVEDNQEFLSNQDKKPWSKVAEILSSILSLSLILFFINIWWIILMSKRFFK